MAFDRLVYAMYAIVLTYLDKYNFHVLFPISVECIGKLSHTGAENIKCEYILPECPKF